MTTIDPALMEKAARALFTTAYGEQAVWENAHPQYRLACTNDAHAALSAVLPDALAELQAEIEQLREAVNREHGEPIDEVYTVDGLAIVGVQIHHLRDERDEARSRLARVLASVEALADEWEAAHKATWSLLEAGVSATAITEARKNLAHAEALRALLADAQATTDEAVQS